MKAFKKGDNLILGLGLTCAMLLSHQNVATSETQLVEYEILYIQNPLPPNFGFIHDRLKVYYSGIDTSTTTKIAEVTNHFGLSEDIETLRWCIGQISLESSARQFYTSGKKKGQVVKSKAGALGITQIMPETAYDYLKKFVKTRHIFGLKMLGATDFDFVHYNEFSDNHRIKLCERWLSNETNNIILWGFIMTHKLEDKTIVHSLIAYNAGNYGLIRYLMAGKNPQKHKYIKEIIRNIKKIEKKVKKD